MKKTLYIAAAVIAVMFAASCQKDDVQAAKKGMTLSANVEETKATITDNGDKTWKFSWELNDVVSVTDPNGKPYDFTYDGKSFKNAEAEPAKGDWTAYFPANEALNIVKQEGTKKWVANHYFVTGTKTVQEDGVSKLDIKMTPKVAVLHLTNTGIAADEYKIYVCTKDSRQSARENITSINTDGTFTTSGYETDYIGTIEPNKEKYFIVPAGTIKLCRFNSATSSSRLGPEKDVAAGKIYNLNINNL